MRRAVLLTLGLLAVAGCKRSTGVGGTSTSGASGASGSGAASTGAAGSSGAGSAGSATGSGSGATGSGSGSAGSGSGGASSGSSCPASYDSLQLSPATTSATIQNGAAAPITFTVAGVRAGASTPLAASSVSWSVSRDDDTPPGAIADGVFQPFAGAGGTVTVTASGCGATGTATVTLTVQAQVTATDGGPSGSDFSGTVVDGDATHAPKIIYPSAETRFPRNIYKVLFQWRKQGGALFRLSFAGPGGTVEVYTDGSHPTCAGVNGLGCWEADAATWTAIAGSNAGSTVQLRISGVASPGATVYRSAEQPLGFSRRDVKGAIFYWAADVGGVQRATVSDAAPENYLVGPQKVPPTALPNGDTVKCAACHTVSRDGTKLAVSGAADGPVAMNKGLWVFDVTLQSPPTPTQTHYPDAMADGFAAFAPDDSKLVWSPRNGGQLVLVDAASGTTLAKAAVGATVIKGTAPDWSPHPGVAELVYGDPAGNISRVLWDGTSFTGPQVLAPKLAGHNNSYPSYSPEGDWVAFTNNNASLYLVAADGGAPVALAAANTVVNNAVVAPSENSMPTWAPPGDLHWVAFNSQRPYGLVTAGGDNQIWVAAVDFARLDGGDPSYPAFRLPFQDLSAKNHRAFWTLDVRDFPDGGVFVADAGPQVPDAGYTPPDAGPCVATGDPCDPAASTCCDQVRTGAFCGGAADGGSVCQEIPFN